MENQPKKSLILLVDDELPLISALSKKLSGAGYTVLTARDGNEGLSNSLAHHPDLILLDIMMPGMDGLRMFDLIREDEWGKTAKIILLTNCDVDDEKLIQIVKNQPAYYLLKNTHTLEDILEKVKITLAHESESTIV